jgi:hypothetical protein
MPEFKNKYFDRLPHWLRWLLLPVVVILTNLLATAAIGIVLWIKLMFSGAADGSWINWLIFYVIQPGGASYLTVIAGVYCIPKHHFVFALILGAIFALFNGMAIIDLSEARVNIETLVAVTCGTLGAGFAILEVKNKL